MPDGNANPNKIVIAIGGNATHPDDIEGTSEQQEAIAAKTAQSLLQIGQEVDQLIITHGNGPVVGKILMRQALTRDRISPMPLDICVAHSQGGIGYLLMQAMENALRKADNPRHVACLLTQVEVDANDQAFEDHTKPIGPFFTETDAKSIHEELGWQMAEDSGRGYRHVVPSPVPKHICDISLIEALSQRGTIVIAGGGGGIPVIRGANGIRHGVAAVIDKDLTSALIANILGIKDFMILTATPKVAVNFGKSDQKFLDRVTLSEIKALKAEGHFPPGSMGPKIDASVRFLERGGERVIIADLEQAMGALAGETGTHILRDNA